MHYCLIMSLNLYLHCSANWILDESALAAWAKNCKSWAKARNTVWAIRLCVWSSLALIYSKLQCPLYILHPLVRSRCCHPVTPTFFQPLPSSKLLLPSPAHESKVFQPCDPSISLAMQQTLTVVLQSLQYWKRIQQAHVRSANKG